MPTEFDVYNDFAIIQSKQPLNVLIRRYFTLETVTQVITHTDIDDLKMLMLNVIRQRLINADIVPNSENIIKFRYGSLVYSIDTMSIVESDYGESNLPTYKD